MQTTTTILQEVTRERKEKEQALKVCTSPVQPTVRNSGRR